MSEKPGIGYEYIRKEMEKRFGSKDKEVIKKRLAKEIIQELIDEGRIRRKRRT